MPRVEQLIGFPSQQVDKSCSCKCLRRYFLSEICKELEGPLFLLLVLQLLRFLGSLPPKEIHVSEILIFQCKKCFYSFGFGLLFFNLHKIKSSFSHMGARFES